MGSKSNGASTVQGRGAGRGGESGAAFIGSEQKKEERKRIVLVYMRQSGSISTCDKAS